MGKCNKSDYNHVLYNYNRARVKSGCRSKKAIEQKITLLKRKEREGDTKWIIDALRKIDARLKSMGINDKMVNLSITHKGLPHLASH